uniref:Uncharacterized protein n=1 Tax=Kalanchoe fedtschenkoi TaxID=63787 RepID=A0A7N0VBG5_KALFE
MTGFSASSCFSPAHTSTTRAHQPPSPALRRLSFLAALLASLTHLAAKLKHLKPRGSKAMRMVHGRNSSAVEMGQDEALWQRAILMGDKCQPLDFSGVIYYDESGQQIPQMPPRSPRSPLPGYLHAQ